VRADYELVQPPEGVKGFFGERGVGGAKCGSTAVVAVVFKDVGLQGLTLVRFSTQLERCLRDMGCA
jgi:hypothetical protein